MSRTTSTLFTVESRDPDSRNEKHHDWHLLMRLDNVRTEKEAVAYFDKFKRDRMVPQNQVRLVRTRTTVTVEVLDERIRE